MQEYINDRGMKCYSEVTEETRMDILEFSKVSGQLEEDKQVALHTNLGSITILNRMTGFGHRDIETGYRDPDGKFWLASAGYDVRWHNPITFGDAIKHIKENANTYFGI